MHLAAVCPPGAPCCRPRQALLEYQQRKPKQKAEKAMSYRVAVVGATGNVGRELLNILHERNFPVEKVHAVASSRSVGREVAFGDDQTLVCENLETFDFSECDFALFSAGGSISEQYCPKAAAQGCIAIDNSSTFRVSNPDIPLVVPEVNGDVLTEWAINPDRVNIIANPNCSTAQLMLPLKALHDIAPITRVVVSTYQATSGAGKEAMDELFTQTRGIFVNDEVKKEQFTKQIAFNCIPHIDVFMEDGFTKEEWKMNVETRKILDPSVKLTATCVRVPAFIGHAEAVNVEFDGEVTLQQAREALENFDGIVYFDKRMDEGYVTQVECAGEDAVYVSRLREDITVENGLSFWCVSDNLRKGAALNAVQIAERLVADGLI